MKKVTILLPTYNDACFIERTLDSVKNQTYTNWEILICDDGSKDNTKEIITKYIKNNSFNNKIKYIYQENSDQLNAIINVMKYATGDYAYILHSDDLLNDNNTLENCINYFEQNKECDVILSDLNIINNEDIIIGKQHVQSYKNKDYIKPLQLLWLGRNLYNDFPFAKIEVFKKEIYKNYLINNCPFWLNVDELTQLNVEKVNFVIRKYRVNDDNYLSNPNARYNVINGEIRTITNLFKEYRIPLYKFQYLIFRLFNKLKLFKIYKPIYFKKETKNKYNILKFVLLKRFNKKEINNNIFLNSLLNFYKSKNKRTINIEKIDSDLFIYQGKDMRRFNKNILSNNLEEFYINFLNEMSKGFNKIVVSNKEDKEKLEEITRFLCINKFVKVEIKK